MDGVPIDISPELKRVLAWYRASEWMKRRELVRSSEEPAKDEMLVRLGEPTELDGYMLERVEVNIEQRIPDPIRALIAANVGWRSLPALEEANERARQYGLPLSWLGFEGGVEYDSGHIACVYVGKITARIRLMIEEAALEAGDTPIFWFSYHIEQRVGRPEVQSLRAMICEEYETDFDGPVPEGPPPELPGLAPFEPRLVNLRERAREASPKRRVVHSKFGVGVVVEARQDILVVDFESVGRKALKDSFVRDV